MKCEACEASAAEVLVDSHRRAPDFHHLCFDCGRQIRKESPHMMLQPDVAATERAILSVLLTGPRNAMDLKIATDHTSPRDVKRLDNRLQALKRGLHVTLDGQRWAITPAGMSYAEVLGVDVKPQRAKPEPKQQPPKQQQPQLEEPAPIPAPSAEPLTSCFPPTNERGSTAASADDRPIPTPEPEVTERASQIQALQEELATANKEARAAMDKRASEIQALQAELAAANKEAADLRETLIEACEAQHFLRSALADFAKIHPEVLAETPNAQLAHAATGVVKYELQEALAHERSVVLAEAEQKRQELVAERNAALDRADQLARELGDIDAAMGLKAPRHVDERLDQVRTLAAERNTLLEAASARVEDRRTIDALLGELAECWSGPLAPDQAAPDSETVLRWAIREIDAARALREREAELEQHVHHLDAMVVRMQGRHRTPEFWADVASEVAGWGSWHANALMPGTTAAVFKTVAALLEVDALAQADLRRARAMQEAA
jgi:hypothetical protein